MFRKISGSLRFSQIGREDHWNYKYDSQVVYSQSARLPLLEFMSPNTTRLVFERLEQNLNMAPCISRNGSSDASLKPYGGIYTTAPIKSSYNTFESVKKKLLNLLF